MTVQDVINDAKYGELQQLAIKNDVDAVMSYINLGLLELHKRFVLRTEEAIVQLVENVTDYTLVNTPVIGGFDLITMPTDCELLYIIAVYGEDGKKLPLNEENNAVSIMTPKYNTIQVPFSTSETYVSVIYCAGPTRVTTVNDVISLSPSLYEALLHYIGYRGHGSINGNINTENNTHYMRFDKSCQVAVEFGLVTTDDVRSRSVEDKGFV